MDAARLLRSVARRSCGARLDRLWHVLPCRRSRQPQRRRSTPTLSPTMLRLRRVQRRPEQSCGSCCGRSTAVPGLPRWHVQWCACTTLIQCRMSIIDYKHLLLGCHPALCTSQPMAGAWQTEACSCMQVCIYFFNLCYEDVEAWRWGTVCIHGPCPWTKANVLLQSITSLQLNAVWWLLPAGKTTRPR